MSKAYLLAALALACALGGGCSFERADPAARSNRATYTITVSRCDNSTVTAYVRDGLMATADGEGAITQPSTQTTRQDPEFAGADPVTAGINAAAHLGGKAIDAYAGKSSDAKSAKGDGSGGECGTGECSDGACCTGGECSD